MQQLVALALALPLMFVEGADVPACKCKPCCPCVDQVRHNFGVDVSKLRKDGVEMTLPPQVLRVFETWHDLPERIEEAVYHGTMIGSGIAWVAIAGLMLALGARRAAK